MLLPADMDNEVKIWYGLMLAITVVNVSWYLNSMLKPSSSHYHKSMKLLAGIYTTVCAVRATLPRIDVEKICLYDSWLSWPLVGRLLATFAELSFISQLAYTLSHISLHLENQATNNKKETKGYLKVFRRVRLYARGCVVVNVVAQSFCWLGITTTVQVWHVFEESIWAITIFGMTVCCYFLYTSLPPLPERSKGEKENRKQAKRSKGVDMQNVRRFLGYFLVCGPVYVAYMFLVDVPMYYKRWREDEESNHQYYTFSEGLYHAASCKVVTGSYSAWGEDFSWMLGYFSMAVWTSIWLVNGIEH